MRFRDFYEDLTIRRPSGAPATPAVSIVLPTFARAHGPLGRSIASVLEQSYGNFELIVVDDGSCDGTEDILADAQRSDSRIIVHRFEKNSGLPALRVNQGILAARGRYIAYQFDDDTWTEDSLKSRVEILEGAKNPSIVYGNALAMIKRPDGSITERILGGEFNFGKLYNQNYIANNSILHHSDLLDTIGLLDPHILARRYSDYDLWLRIGRMHQFNFLDEHVSTVSVNEAGSLGISIELWLDRYRKYVEIDRTDLLLKHKIADYYVCGIEHLSQQFEQEEIDSAYRDEITPFIARNNDYWPGNRNSNPIPTRRKRRRLLVTKPDYSTSIDVTIRNFTSLPNFPIRHYFVREHEIAHSNLLWADTVLLYRTVLPRTTDLIRRRRSEISFVYLMDDNMLRIGEMGDAHSYLAPGTPAHGEIQSQIRGAHACIGYSQPIVSDMKALNPRVFRLDTNIPLRFISPREYRRAERLRIAVLSGSGRHAILESLWPALKAFAMDDPEAVEIHIWGLDPTEFGALPCSLSWRPFEHSYDLYRNALLAESFDVVLTPLDASTLAAQGKSPVKLLEAVVCGAICIFTDAPPYAALPDDICIKARNTVPAWIEALRSARELGEAGRSQMLERAREYVVDRFSTEGQINDFLASFDAADIHRRLGGKRIAYVFHEAPLGGATLHLLIHAGFARACGFEIVGIVPARSPLMESFVKRWEAVAGKSPLLEGEWRSGYLEHDGTYVHRAIDAEDRRRGAAIAQQLRPYDVGFIHSATWIPAATCAARSLDVPCVASVHRFYATPPKALDNFADAIHCSSLKYARVWSDQSGAPARRIVCPVSPTFFDMYDRRRADGPSVRRRRIVVSGTLQRRKNQLAAIEAVELLAQQGFDVEMHLLGYDHFDTQYFQECNQAAARIAGRVFFHGFVENPEGFYGTRYDILLIAATEESMPQTMLQAMAAGLLVVSTDVGGVTELIKHRYSGVIASGDGATDLADALQLALTLSDGEQRQMTGRAHRAISMIGTQSHVRAELIDLYNQAFEVASLRKNARADERQAAAMDTRPMTGPVLQSVPHSVFPGQIGDDAVAPSAATMISPKKRSDIEFDMVIFHDEVAIDQSNACATVIIDASNEGNEGIAIVLSTYGGGVSRISLRIATTVRPDLILRSSDFDLPADGVPRRVSCRFAPLSLTGKTRLRVELSADRGAIRLYTAKGKRGAALIELLA
ncbi:MAG: glycosyltransferase [Rhodospirillaceae bacterium]|nr:glycosyltransferase [Rhodospirillaceae bacterium]